MQWMRLSTAKLMQKFRNWGHTFSRLWLNCKPLGVTWHIQNLTFQALKSRFGSEVENLHNVLLWKYILVTALNIKNVRSNICPRNSTCLLFAVNMNYKRPYINSFKMAAVLGVLIHSFFYKNLFYKNIEAEKCPKIKNMLRTSWGWEGALK